MAVKKPSASKKRDHSASDKSNVVKSSRKRKSKSQPGAPPKRSAQPTKKHGNRKAHTAEELGVPQLNMITPVGVQRPRGKKKGKVYVDDAESMATIIAMVNADKEGQIESKMMKARHMEELREARRQEATKKEEMKKSKLESIKSDIKKKKRHKMNNDSDPQVRDESSQKPIKRVSFR